MCWLGKLTRVVHIMHARYGDASVKTIMLNKLSCVSFHAVGGSITDASELIVTLHFLHNFRLVPRIHIQTIKRSDIASKWLGLAVFGISFIRVIKKLANSVCFLRRKNEMLWECISLLDDLGLVSCIDDRSEGILIA